MDEADTAEERVLRDAVLRGDESAWRTVYGRHADGLYAWVRGRSTNDPELALDVVQESWTIAVRRMRRFDPSRGTLQSWLRGIARNVLRNEWRRRARLAPTVADPDGSGTAHDRTEPAADENRRASIERLQLAMSELSPHYQAVLREKYAEGQSVAEISNRYGASPKAVESLLSRARDALRKAYALVLAEEESR